jgi:hypothetical protein
MAATRAQVSRAKAVTPTPAILRAQEELRSTREQLDLARHALLQAAKQRERASLRDVVQAAQDATDLDPGMIQHALWILVHERALVLDDDLDVTPAAID